MKKKRNPLNPNHQVRTRREYIDYDYLKELNPEEYKFMQKFTDEYYGGAIRVGDDESLHNTDELRKDCYNRNNRQNRDIMGLAKTTGRLDSLTECEVDLRIVRPTNEDESRNEIIDRKDPNFIET